MPMETIAINYGDNIIDLFIPKERLVWRVSPHRSAHRDNKQNAVEAIEETLGNPVATKALGELVKGRPNIMIVVDDNTRPTPVNKILPIVVSELNKSGIEDNSIRVMIALGTHRKMSHSELYEKLGKDICKRLTVLQHDYMDENNLINLGYTASGIPVKINRQYHKADFKIAIGNIIPHVNAGWSGGAKILLPGICGKETIDKFHLNASLNLDKIQARADNFIRQEMEEIASKAGLDFIINTILDREGNIFGIVSGHPVLAHRKGVELAKRLYSFRINEKADLTIVSSYPADIDLWQASKALTVSTMVTRPKGSIVLVSPCTEGVTPSHPVVMELGKTPAMDVFKAVASGKINDVTGASIHMEITSATFKYCVYLFSEGIDEKEAQKLGIKKTYNLQQFIDNYIMEYPQCKIGVINMGSELIPDIVET